MNSDFHDLNQTSFNELLNKQHPQPTQLANVTGTMWSTVHKQLAQRGFTTVQEVKRIAKVSPTGNPSVAVIPVAAEVLKPPFWQPCDTEKIIDVVARVFTVK